MAKTQAELAAELKTVSTAVQKIGSETSTLIKKIADLESAISQGGTVTPEVQAALDDVKAQVAVVDDLVPDAPPPVV